MMKRLALLIVVCVVVPQFPLISSLQRHSRSKRGVLDLIVTLWCYREKLKVPLLGINLYGCYCGTGGSGVPVDAVDKCCFLHDCCYHHSRVFLKCHSKVKWQLYHFSCHRSQTKCTSLSVCGRMACECDKQFAECLTQARPNKKHFFYNRKDLCPGPKDTCPAIYPNATEISYKTRASAHEQYMKQLLQRKKRNNKQKLSPKN